MFAALFACNNQVLAHPHPGGHNQWGGMMGGYQQPQGFGGQQQGYGGQQQGFGGQQRGHNGGGGAGNFGQGGGYSQNRGGQQWQSGGQGAEAYKMNVFNEPDRYGYDYTIPGATVHYLMHKKREFRLVIDL